MKTRTLKSESLMNLSIPQVITRGRVGVEGGQPGLNLKKLSSQNHEIRQRWIRGLLVLLLVVSTPLGTGLFSAQDVSFTFDNALGFSNYLLGSRLVMDASYSSHAASLSSIISDKSRVYLDLSHNQIFPYAEYSSSRGEIGLQFRYLEIRNHQLFAGLYGTMNRFRDTYSYYNSMGIGLYLKWKYYLKASQLVQAGMDLNRKKFDNVSEASNTEQEVYLLYNQSFKTKTSLNLRSGLARQNFWPQTQLEGQGRDLTTVEIDPIPDNMLFTTELRISQSLGSKVGLTLWLESQSLLNDEGGSLVLQDGLNNPFIDRFRWEGPSTALRLIYRINGRHSLNIAHSFVDKSFLDVPVYLYDFDLQNYVIENENYVDLGMDRADTRQSFQLTWNLMRQQFLGASMSDLELGFNVGWTQNRSNDSIYDYESMNYSISINLNN